MLYIILDLEKEGWQSLVDPQSLINEVATFINIYKKINTKNELKIINNKKEVFLESLKFSEYDKNLNRNLVKNSGTDIMNDKNSGTDIMNDKNSQSDIKSDKNSGTDIMNDIAFAICKGCDRILLVKTSPKIDIIKCTKIQHAAQKFNVRIDVLSSNKCVYLEQLAVSTNGLYIEKDVIKFFTNNISKQTFYMTKCMCHKKEILLGLVCPVCLAVYCKFVPICKNCKTKFKF
ncbi:General transcription factor IIH subunit 3 [Dictyocoela muelleri]|nr:General transcription factor IIH subunit 3 [Dictyocoela muelleri]